MEVDGKRLSPERIHRYEPNMATRELGGTHGDEQGELHACGGNVVADCAGIWLLDVVSQAPA